MPVVNQSTSMMINIILNYFRNLILNFNIQRINFNKGLFLFVKNMIVIIVTWTSFFIALYWYVYTLYVIASF